MLLFSLLVAGSFILGSMMARDIDPAAMNAARFALGALLIGALAALRGQVTRAAFVAPWRYLILGGLFAVYFVLMFEGLKTAPPVSASAVFTLTPVLTAIAGYILLRQVTTPWMGLALAVGGAGALWVIFRADLGALLAFEIGPGEAIYFIGVVAHAIYTPMVRKLNRGEPAVAFSFGTICGGLLVLLIWGAPAIRATDWVNLSPLVWFTIAYLAIFASAMTFVLLQYASLRLPSAKVMAYTYLIPSWVIVLDILIGRGAPPFAVLTGIGLSVLALLMLLKTG